MGYPPPGDLLHPWMEPASLTSLASAGGFFTTSTTSELYSLVLPLLILCILHRSAEVIHFEHRLDCVVLLEALQWLSITLIWNPVSLQWYAYKTLPNSLPHHQPSPIILHCTNFLLTVCWSHTGLFSDPWKEIRPISALKVGTGCLLCLPSLSSRL